MTPHNPHQQKQVFPSTIKATTSQQKSLHWLIAHQMNNVKIEDAGCHKNESDLIEEDDIWIEQ